MKKLIFGSLVVIGCLLAYYIKAQESVGQISPFQKEGTRGVTILIPYNGDASTFLNGQGVFASVTGNTNGSGNTFNTIYVTNLTVVSNVVFETNSTFNIKGKGTVNNFIV